MKHYYFFTILVVLILKAGISCGQNYHPLLNDSMTWDAWSLDYSLPACSETDITRSFVNGDTVINTITYKRISGYHAINLTPMPCPVWAFDNTVINDFALMREDTALRQVWLYNESISTEFLLFDFSLSQGDTFVTSYSSTPQFPTDTMIVDSVYAMQLPDGTLRTRINMHALYYQWATEFMIEGIGGSAGVYLPPLNIGIGFETLLGCVIYNNDQLYNPTQFSTYCPGVTGNTNIIYGKAYVDLNTNMVYDAGDSPLDCTRVTEAVSGMFDFTDAAGNYQVYVTDTGNFNVSGIGLNNFISNPVLHTATFGSFLQTDSLNDFAYQPISIFDDLQLLLTPLHKFRSGLNASYKMWIRNKGTTNQMPVVVVYQDAVLDYVSSSFLPSVANNDSIVWILPNLAPFQYTDLTVTFQVDSGVAINTPVLSTAEVLPVISDAFPLNNMATSTTHIFGSYDPNDISVDRDTLFTNEMSNPPFLNYLVRFQNTGNDTAFVVRIENGLYQTLDVSTLEFVSASHPCEMNWNHLLNRMEFLFEDINLPDSTTNEVGSHGFVSYRVKPVSGLTAGNFIANTANIFFDFNLPVSTNYVWTYIEEPTTLPEYSFNSIDFRVYPNPVDEAIFIRFNLEHKIDCNIQVIDLFGRKQLEEDFNDITGNITLNLSGISSGIYLVKVTSGSKSGFKKIVKL